MRASRDWNISSVCVRVCVCQSVLSMYCVRRQPIFENSQYITPCVWNTMHACIPVAATMSFRVWLKAISIYVCSSIQRIWRTAAASTSAVAVGARRGSWAPVYWIITVQVWFSCFSHRNGSTILNSNLFYTYFVFLSLNNSLTLVRLTSWQAGKALVSWCACSIESVVVQYNTRIISFFFLRVVLLLF